MNNQEEASPVEEALKKQVRRLARPLHLSLAPFSRLSHGAQGAWRQAAGCMWLQQLGFPLAKADLATVLLNI